jgi:predicted ABC-type ATPase
MAAGPQSPGRPFIFVLAGVNGAGKSSVGGAMLAEHGLTWYNPDSFARALVNAGVRADDANGLAWMHGKALLEAAIANGANHAFETTLGASTIAELLKSAALSHDIVILFCGLDSPEEHLARISARVASGGHDIPEAKVRERWIASRLNLIKLLPALTHLQVFDNSRRAEAGQEIPDPVLLLETAESQLLFPDPQDRPALARIPAWARPIVQAAIELDAARVS